MGYTHYWKKSKTKVSQEVWDKALTDIEAIVQSEGKILGDAGGDEGTEPVIDKNGIYLNGLGDNAHETFFLPRKEKKLEEFSFCKTALKPYDKVVVACLIVLHNAVPSMDINSDGEKEDHKKGLELAKKITGNKNLVTLSEEVPSNAEKFILKSEVHMFFKITVVQLVPDKDLDEEDSDCNPKGLYHYDASDSEEALDKFHRDIPIACLDDFSIKCEYTPCNAEKFIMGMRRKVNL